MYFYDVFIMWVNGVLARVSLRRFEGGLGVGRIGHSLRECLSGNYVGNFVWVVLVLFCWGF